MAMEQPRQAKVRTHAGVTLPFARVNWERELAPFAGHLEELAERTGGNAEVLLFPTPLRQLAFMNADGLRCELSLMPTETAAGPELVVFALAGTEADGQRLWRSHEFARFTLPLYPRAITALVDVAAAAIGAWDRRSCRPRS